MKKHPKGQFLLQVMNKVRRNVSQNKVKSG